MFAALRNLTSLVSRTPVTPSLQIQPCRNKNGIGPGWVDWRMIKDFKKRKEVAKQSKLRLRLNAMRKSKVLPPELREICDKEIAELPRYGCICQVVFRCSLTSRNRGTVMPYRVSRIMFKHFADYNYISGMQRAMW